MGHKSHGAGAGLGGATIGHRAGSRRLGFFDFSRHHLIPLAGAPTAPSGGQAEPKSGCPRSRSYPNTTELAGFMKVNDTPAEAAETRRIRRLRRSAAAPA